MADKSVDALHEGYATNNAYRWICKACFDDFMDLFEWKVTGMPNTAVNTDALPATRLP
jgi:hypothetical protein